MPKNRLGLLQRKKLQFLNMMYAVRRTHPCNYCGDVLTRKTATIDHRIPTSRGGKHLFGNFALCCLKCNGAKGSRTDREYRIELLQTSKKTFWWFKDPNMGWVEADDPLCDVVISESDFYLDWEDKEILKERQLITLGLPIKEYSD